jgi:hypothetical protein
MNGSSILHFRDMCKRTYLLENFRRNYMCYNPKIKKGCKCDLDENSLNKNCRIESNIFEILCDELGEKDRGFDYFKRKCLDSKISKDSEVSEFTLQDKFCLD